MPPQPVTLITVAHAGASVTSYMPLAARLGERVIFHGAELPGHGRRMREPLLTSVEAMAQDVLATCGHLLREPYALFGHSMGALVVHALALALRAAGLPQPGRIFVSACCAPGRSQLPRDVADLDKDAFWRFVSQYNGVPAEFMTYPELLEVFEPILRADFRAVTSYQPAATAPLAAPITAFLGLTDSITNQDMAGWQAWTNQPLEHLSFPGGHFYLLEQTDPLAACLQARCPRTAA